MGLCPWPLPPSPCCSICRAERQRPDQKPPDSSVECEVCNTPTKNFLGPCHQYLSNSRAALSCGERLGAGTQAQAAFSHLRRVWLGVFSIAPCHLFWETPAGHADQATSSLGLRKGISSSAVRLWPARGLAFLLSLKSCREVPQGLTEDVVGAARAEEGTEIRP